MILWLTAGARATTLVVSPGGAFPTIQGAINAAVDGDLISVSAGTYPEALDFGGKAIEVRGQSAAAVIIDPAGGATNAVTFSKGEDGTTILADVTVRNGAQRGAFVSGASPTFDGVVFDHLGSSASIAFSGGGAWVNGGSPLFLDCTFTGNSGYNGGDLYLTNGASVVVAGGAFTDGSATYGGSMYVASGDLTLDGASVVSAEATTEGGGIYVAAAASLSTLSATFTGNTPGTTFSGDNGGAVWLGDQSVYTDIGSTFTDNEADSGGAIYATGATLVLEDTVFSSNGKLVGVYGDIGRTAFGGAIYAGGMVATTFTRVSFLDNYADYYGAVYWSSFNTFVAVDCVWDGNSTEGTGTFGGAGGALAVVGFGAAATFENAVFTDNLGAYAGAIYASGLGSLTIRNSTFTNNGSDVPTAFHIGGAVEIESVKRTEIVGNRFFGNHTYTGGAVRLTASTGALVGDDSIRNNLFQENTSAGKGGALYVDSPYLSLENNTFVGNASFVGGGGAAYLVRSGEVVNNVFAFQYAGGGVYGPAAGAYTYNDWSGNIPGDVGDGLTTIEAFGTGTIFSSPSFTAWSDNFVFDDDLTPAAGSPLIDSGDPAIPDWDGSVADIGYSGGVDSPMRDMDDDGAPFSEDCDDEDPARYPGAPEIWYSGVDEDCLGGDDFDQDGDEYVLALDCDDEDAGANPGAAEIWYDDIDEDCDGASDHDRDLDGQDRIPVGADCDDLDALAYAGALDAWYDGVDSDCDGRNDFDQDGDGDSVVGVGGDCADLDAARSSLVAEIWYDGVDSDCDGADDFDRDGDGFPLANDCDDGAPAVNPGVAEVWYDGLDSDCDGVDDFDQDADGDRSVDFGGGDCADTDPTKSSLTEEVWYDGVDGDCSGGSDYDRDGDGDESPADCADTDPTVGPSAAEVWYDGIDGDCDGANDYDQDGDGDSVVGFGGDCDDLGAAVSSLTPEVWYDGVDGDCDGGDDFDRDGDGSPAPADCDDQDAAVFPGVEGCEAVAPGCGCDQTPLPLAGWWLAPLLAGVGLRRRPLTVR